MKAYNYQLLTKYGDVVDQTQLDEVNEELAREIFSEKRNDLSKYSIIFEEMEIENEDNAGGGMSLTTAQPSS